MPMRSKMAVAIGLSCLASAALGGNALAGGGERGGSALEVEVRGVVTGLSAATTTPAVAPATITVSPGGTLAPWTCALRDGADTSAIVLNTTVVTLKCRDRDGVLTAKKVRTSDDSDDSTGKVRIKARGLATAYTAFTVATPGTPAVPGPPAVPAVPPTAAIPGSITINPGTGLPPVTCAVTDRTRVRGIPVVGTGTIKVECRTKDGALVAKKIRVAKDKDSSPVDRRGGTRNRDGDEG